MSSILDALNKLEQEKSQSLRESGRSEAEPATAAHELVGRSVLRDRVTLRVTPAMLMVGLGTGAVLLVAVTFSAALLFARSSNDAQPISREASQVASAPVETAVQTTAPEQSAPAQPVTVEPQPGAPPMTAPPSSAPASLAEQVPLQSSGPALVDSTELPPPAPPSLQSEAKIPAAQVEAAPPPKESPINKETALNVTAPVVLPPARANSNDSETGIAAAPEPSPAPTESYVERPRTRVTRAAEPEAESTRRADVDLSSLPELTPIDQARYGFKRIRVNIVKAPGETNPQGWAIISITEEGDGGEPIMNRPKVYVGQRLQQSSLRIFKIEAQRIGVEDIRSGDRYRLSF